MRNCVVKDQQKIGLRIKELERLYGIELGSNRYEKNSHLKTQEQLAKDMGMDVDTLNIAKDLSLMENSEIGH